MAGSEICIKGLRRGTFSFSFLGFSPRGILARFVPRTPRKCKRTQNVPFSHVIGFKRNETIFIASSPILYLVAIVSRK